MSNCLEEKFKFINQLVSKACFSFQVWDSAYQMEFWAGLGTTVYEIDFVREQSVSGNLDIEAPMELMEWLPYARGESLVKAMENLEYRLSLLPEYQIPSAGHDHTEWKLLVKKAIDLLKEDWMAEFDDFPETFNDALKTLKEE